MDTRWEFTSTDEMFNLLVGDSFGDAPLSRLSEIKKQKFSTAEEVIKLLKLNSQDVVLEIGSGSGLLSSIIAPRVRHLYCRDISASFIDCARRNCSHLSNIDFKCISSADLFDLKESSITAAFANNVFIHLNLFDIYLYFEALARVMSVGGRLWFDVAFVEEFESSIPENFVRMTQEYKQNPQVLSGLIQFNSKSAILSIAKSFGFFLAPQQMDSISLAFIKDF
ncbi:MAG: class I SAM-dependent methyltransferase [Bdellovibrionaceae bacterium]|nr:class I SAM-dependent methyltransferase [Pseudobdellovibrionaceae bacterium]